VHGPDMDNFIRECMLKQQGPMLRIMGPKAVRAWVERTFDMVKLWDSWGIPMKRNGKYDFSGHAYPGRMRQHLKYNGRNQKIVLTEKALEKGATIMNRIMIIDLIGDTNGVVGALGIDTRRDRLVVFRANRIILGTGFMIRMYPNVTPALLANNTRPFTLTGDGRAMAYRIGAELVNMEMLARQPGMKNFCRSGQASWIGVCRDVSGKPIGKYMSEPDMHYSDMIMEVDSQIYEKYQQAGTGPVYMDCTGISRDDCEYMVNGLKDEGNHASLEHLKEEGVDLRKNLIEFDTYELRSTGSIATDEHAETSVPGLYAVGDESGLSISGASIFGWIAAEHAVKHLNDTLSRPEHDVYENRINEIETYIASMHTRTNGPDWYEANLALNHTMADYAGLVRSETMLQAGLSHLQRLKDKLDNTLIARNRWELTRCLEVVNLYDLGELVFFAALARTESRGLHRRIDYPYTDPLYNGKILAIKRAIDGPRTVWCNLPD
jgi:succinate dehydrogenase/fumarate reductase flavoprotein subunit